MRAATVTTVPAPGIHSLRASMGRKVRDCLSIGTVVDG